MASARSRKRQFLFHVKQSRRGEAAVCDTLVLPFLPHPLDLPPCRHATAGATFSHKDWELACDNTRTCRAAGYHEEEDDGPNATILPTRAAGPNQLVTVELQLTDDERRPAPDQLEMSIDGRAVGTVRTDPKSSLFRLTDAQVHTLLPALLKDGRNAWTGKGTTWTISTAGSTRRARLCAKA
jgi:hypothetical protein